MSSFRDTSAFHGTQVFGEWIWDDSLVEYRLFKGSAYVNRDSPILLDMGLFTGPEALGLAQQQLTNLGVPSVFHPTTFHYENVSGDSSGFEGFNLVWNSPLPEWRFGYTRFQAKIHSQGNLVLDPGDIRNPLELTLHIHPAQIYSAEYTKDEWKITYEKMTIDLKMNNQTPFFRNSYFQVNRQMNSSMEMALVFSRIQTNIDADTDTNPYDHGTYLNDKGITIRKELQENWSLKLEYHRMEGTASIRRVLNPDLRNQKDWEMFLVKTTINF